MPTPLHPCSKLPRLGLALLCAGPLLTGCNAAKRQNPVGADSSSAAAAARSSPAQQLAAPAPEKAETYTTKAGDTLRSIAARPDIYADPDLWPLLAEANKGVVGNMLENSELLAGLNLQIPRDLSAKALEQAREKSRGRGAEAKRRETKALIANLAREAREPRVRVRTRTLQPLASAPAVQPAASPSPEALAPRQGRRERARWPLVVLVAGLAGMGAVLFAFSRRERRTSA